MRNSYYKRELEKLSFEVNEEACVLLEDVFHILYEIEQEVCTIFDSADELKDKRRKCE
jgi:hypothetical protein